MRNPGYGVYNIYGTGSAESERHSLATLPLSSSNSGQVLAKSFFDILIAMHVFQGGPRNGLMVESMVLTDDSVYESNSGLAISQPVHQQQSPLAAATGYSLVSYSIV